MNQDFHLNSLLTIEGKVRVKERINMFGNIFANKKDDPRLMSKVNFSEFFTREEINGIPVELGKRGRSLRGQVKGLWGIGNNEVRSDVAKQGSVII